MWKKPYDESVRLYRHRDCIRTTCVYCLRLRSAEIAGSGPCNNGGVEEARWKDLRRFGPQIYALLRIVAGLLFACHGIQKLFGLLGGTPVVLASQMGLAGVIEIVGG